MNYGDETMNDEEPGIESTKNECNIITKLEHENSVPMVTPTINEICNQHAGETKKGEDILRHTFTRKITELCPDF